MCCRGVWGTKVVVIVAVAVIVVGVIRQMALSPGTQFKESHLLAKLLLFAILFVILFLNTPRLHPPPPTGCRTEKGTLGYFDDSHQIPVLWKLKLNRCWWMDRCTVFRASSLNFYLIYQSLPSYFCPSPCLSSLYL